MTSIALALSRLITRLLNTAIPSFARAHKNGTSVAKSLFVIACLAMAGCSSLEFPWVYRISVQQGNILDQEDVDQLEKGMTKRQVQYVMGSPMLVDTFNNNRWDYYYSRRDGKGNTKTKQLTLYFEDDKYVRHEGDIVPSLTEKAKKSVNEEEAHATEDALRASQKAKDAKF